MADFTFAIVNWNTRDMLRACLRSIEAASGGFAVQVLVADNGSTDGSADMVAREFPGVTLVRHEHNLGFAPAHATLFPRSRGRCHVLFNSDAELLPGCLEAMDRRLRADERIGIVGPQLVGPDGEIQPGCRRFPTLASQFVEATGLGRLFPRSRAFNGYRMGDFDHRSPREVDQVMGSAFFIRASMAAEIGFLDTDFFMYYEEVDYCLRARKAGYRVFFDPAGRVRHAAGGTSRRVRVATIRRKMRSMHHYFRKHRGKSVYLPLVAICALEGATHVAAAAVTLRRPSETFRAYGLGFLDVLTAQPASRADDGSSAHA